MVDSKNTFEQGSIEAEQRLFTKIMEQEVYDCKNPLLLKALKDTGSIDIGFPAMAAEALGKCLQALMKERQETKVTQKTLDDAMNMVKKFDKTAAGDAIYFLGEQVIRILSATWTKGDQVAIGLAGMSKTDYEAFCRALNQKYTSPNPVHISGNERK